jgi:hypothetical protein
MKKISIALTFLIFSICAYSQAPHKMTYQAVIRNSGNNLVTSTTIGMRISIIQGSLFGPSVYVETQTPVTNINGLATIEIGTGTVVVGNFSTIDWGNGPYFIKTETDPTGGIAYSITGTSELLSVPYSFYSSTADSSNYADVSNTANFALTSNYSNTSGFADSANYSNTSGLADSAEQSFHAHYADSIAIDRAYIFLRKKATIQNIPTNTNTQITNYDIINSQGFTLNNATGNITFNEPGVYIITLTTSFNALTQGRKGVWLTSTSTNHAGWLARAECSDDANRLSSSFMGEFNAGDQIALWVYQNTGVTVPCPNTTLAMDETVVNIERIH